MSPRSLPELSLSRYWTAARIAVLALQTAQRPQFGVARRPATPPCGIPPHMLRHACGFALANKGHDTGALQAYLGHKNIQHTVRYTELSPGRFKDFWR